MIIGLLGIICTSYLVIEYRKEKNINPVSVKVRSEDTLKNKLAEADIEELKRMGLMWWFLPELHYTFLSNRTFREIILSKSSFLVL